MFELYELIKTKQDFKFEGRDGKTVIIPKGSEAYIVDKNGNNGLIIEFVNKQENWPLAFGCFENEIEKISN